MLPHQVALATATNDFYGINAGLHGRINTNRRVHATLALRDGRILQRHAFRSADENKLDFLVEPASLKAQRQGLSCALWNR